MVFINSGWSYTWDDCSKVPYIQNQGQRGIICFYDAQSIALIRDYVKEKGVAGIIIWELSQDYYEDSLCLA